MSTVHIVCAEVDSDHILARLARYLRDALGWTVGTEVDPSAACQYFIPYLLYSQRYTGWHGTPVAAYFSHYDDQNRTKAQWWETAAERVDLRIVTAKQYGKMVRPYGPVAYCHAPVDQHLFDYIPRNQLQHKPVVGVSGMVYGDGRKGEHLIMRLYDETRAVFSWKACGRGWPIGHVPYLEWDQMAGFYQSLDVFVCASLIEGVPMPPLEALACGVPVVIPKGVGMLDELPKIAGIHRYEAGNYDSLKEALDRAVNKSYDPEALAKAAQDWSIEAWVEDHADAFEKLLEPDLDIPKALPDWRGRAGVYIVAFGGPARKCAKTALASWAKHNPDVPTALVGEQAIGPEGVFIAHPDADIGGRQAKIKIYDVAPAAWDYVLYLDADTETVAEVTLFFDILRDGYEFVICKNPVRYQSTRYMLRPDNHEECEKTFDVMGTDDQLQLNGGVFAFRRCDRVKEFFRIWMEEYQRWGQRDQAALLRALWRHPLRLFVLGNQWNCVDRYYEAEVSAGILHRPESARRWTGVLHGRLDEPGWERNVTK